jgi:hypothetical protein
MAEAGTTMPEVEEDACAANNDDSRQGLRIGAIFIILVRYLSLDPRHLSPSLHLGHFPVWYPTTYRLKIE